MSKGKALTLIELLVVIAVIAVLTAILLPVYSRSRSAAFESTTISHLKQLAIAGSIYSDSHGIVSPLSIHPLVTEGLIDLRIIVSPSDMTELGQGGLRRAEIHQHTGTFPPKHYRFSYWGREEVGITEHILVRDANEFEGGVNTGWIVYFKRNDASVDLFEEGREFFRLLDEGSVVTRRLVYYKENNADDIGGFMSVKTLFADYSQEDVMRDLDDELEKTPQQTYSDVVHSIDRNATFLLCLPSNNNSDR